MPGALEETQTDCWILFFHFYLISKFLYENWGNLASVPLWSVIAVAEAFSLCTWKLLEFTGAFHGEWPHSFSPCFHPASQTEVRAQICEKWSSTSWAWASFGLAGVNFVQEKGVNKHCAVTELSNPNCFYLSCPVQRSFLQCWPLSQSGSSTELGLATLKYEFSWLKDGGRCNSMP